MKLMPVKLTRTLLLLALLLCAAIGSAQAETPTEECPISASDLRRSVGHGAQAFQTEAQKLTPPLAELEPPKLSDLSKIQPERAVQSLGEQANRVRAFEWREGASALASGAASRVAEGWQGVKEVAPASARCLQQWTGRASNVVQNVPAPDLPEQEVKDVPEPDATIPGVELGTEVVNGVRRAVIERVMPENNLRVGSNLIGALADAFPTAFRLVKYYVIWLVSTSILVTVLLLVILARLSYILLFPSRRSENSKS